MKKQSVNPFLPSYEYVPDSEPYVFGDRVYIYGSHDAFNGENFCINDYVCYSASIKDLTEWKFEGVIYNKTQDPMNQDGASNLFAPDIIKGIDGNYYLYYQLHKEIITSVAISKYPTGPFVFYGHVKHMDGQLYGTKEGDAYSFDPAVLIDDGRVYLYHGFSPLDDDLRKMMEKAGATLNGGCVVELDHDMLTVIGKEEKTVPGELFAKGTEFEGRGFFEASSIRKINDLYYLVYSSSVSYDLSYAVSSAPTGPWKYGGRIIALGDVGIGNITEQNARNFLGNNHGGLVCVEDQWYIFYHRQTNKQSCARQACAEKVYFNNDGSISQVEMTSCGLNKGPLDGVGEYKAYIACNLKGKKGTYAYVETCHHEDEYPYFTQSGEDREAHGDQYIANMKDGSQAGFKYFYIEDTNYISIKVRGNGKGKVIIACDEFGKMIGKIECDLCEEWRDFSANIELPKGKRGIYFTYIGTGHLDFYSFELKNI